MSPISSIISNTTVPGFVSRQKLPSLKNPNPGTRLSSLCSHFHKRTVFSDTPVRDLTPVKCLGMDIADDWTVQSISHDAGDAAGREHVEGSSPGRWCTGRDAVTAGVLLMTHVLSLMAPFYFTWGALWVAVGLYFVTGVLGVKLSYHRHLSHWSFKIPKWLEYTFAYCGALAVQRDPIDWVSTHRFHHMYSDSDKDPHSPLHGIWFGHITWLFDSYLMFRKRGGQTIAADLEKQPFYRFLEKTYLVHLLGMSLVLYALGGLPFLTWGMGVRVVWLYHVTFSVSSIGHTRGNQPWNTGDSSRNNWWIAMLTLGEGWHNNHHAFEYSARHGLEWWQFDLTWYIICFLEAVGLATDVKLPSESHKLRRALKPQQQLD